MHTDFKNFSEKAIQTLLTFITKKSSVGESEPLWEMEPLLLVKSGLDLALKNTPHFCYQYNKAHRTWGTVIVYPLIG